MYSSDEDVQPSTSHEHGNKCAHDETAAWNHFRNWVHCICVVTFDLELGQALEIHAAEPCLQTIYPANAQLTDKEKMNICYLAFPDSNSGCMGDTVFHVRMRRFAAALPATKVQRVYNRTTPTIINVDSNYYHGFVFFRQVKDATIPRGYFQKSLVLLTHLPLINLFTHIIQTLAPEFFDNGEPALEAACHDMDEWPAPTGGANYVLPLMGTLVQCRIPARTDPTAANKLSPARTLLSTQPILASVYEPNLYEHVASLVPHLHLIWELVLLAEPIVIMATSPQTCAGLVHAIVSLIWPLQCCCDYRPFFTIHDSEFKEYTAGKQPAPVILGVTNPFFAKTLSHWPHVIRVAEQHAIVASPSSNSLHSMDVHDDPQRSASPRHASPIAAHKMRKQADARRTLDHKPGVYSDYKPLLHADKVFIKSVQKGAVQGRPSAAQSVLIRRQFVEITQSFVIPLERYMASLMPLQRQISALKAAPVPRAFDADEFMQTLDMNGPALTSGIKGDWNELYRCVPGPCRHIYTHRRFLHSATFVGWFRERYRNVVHKLRLLHLDVLCTADLHSALHTMSLPDVQLVDLIMKLCEKWASGPRASARQIVPAQSFVERYAEQVRPTKVTQLRNQIQVVFDAMSPDLQHVMMSNSKLALGTILKTNEPVLTTDSTLPVGM